MSNPYKAGDRVRSVYFFDGSRGEVVKPLGPSLLRVRWDVVPHLQGYSYTSTVSINGVRRDNMEVA